MIEPIAFSIDGYDLELSGMTGKQAYGLAAEGNWMGLLVGGVGEEGTNWILQRLDDPRDPMTLRSLWRISHALAKDVYGVPWWSAQRLGGTRKNQWLSFEVWTVRKGFDPWAPWVGPRRMTAAIMGWLASSCQKEVEWQRIEMEISSPPPYAVWLPTDAAVQPGSPASASSFMANTPAWASGQPPVPAEAADGAGEPEEGEAEPASAPEVPEPLWGDQPVMTLDSFAAQAKAWARSRRPEEGGEESLPGESP